MQPTALGEGTFPGATFMSRTLPLLFAHRVHGTTTYTPVIYSNKKIKMPPPTKRRKTEPTVVEEITFDPSARQEYLTGFHKRKLERAKHAREIAEKQARLEKLEARKQVRSEMVAPEAGLTARLS